MSGLEIIYIDPAKLRENSWNPNSMSDEMFRKEVESIKEFGFVNPITVRPWQYEKPGKPGNISGYTHEIINGEHRRRAAEELGLKLIPCVVLDVDDTVAKQLTVVLNDIHGEPNTERLASLVRDLSARRSVLDLERILPYRREKLAEMIAERRADFDWDALKRPKIEEKTEEVRQWVERIYRLPLSAALVIDQALGKAKKDAIVDDDWKALELICADYIAGA